MPDSPIARPDFKLLPGYKAGAKAPGAVSLASNEAPFGPLPGAAEVIAAAAAHSHLYPDPGSSDLVERLSQHLDISTDRIALGTGSVAICQQITTTMASPGDEVMFAWRSFEAYPIVTRLAHATAVRVPLASGLRHDLEAMAAAITPATKVVFVCTPNNPTGPEVSHQELLHFLQRVPSRVLVVVDEAYYEYAAVSQAPAGGHVDARGLVEEFPNVLVLRTFSKAYAMAGLRVGYAFGSAELIGDLRKSALPFGVNHVAQAAAVAALDQQDELMRRVRSTVVERDQVVAQARAMGFEVANSSANFYWLPLAEASEEFAAACREAGVLVRAFPGEGVRVTVGEPQANAVVLRQLAAFAGQTS